MASIPTVTFTEGRTPPCLYLPLLPVTDRYIITSVTLPADLKAAPERQTAVEDRSQTAIIRQSLRAYLSYHGAESQNGHNGERNGVG